MPSYNESTRGRVADINLGLRVDRAAALVTQATVPLFTVAGGRVLMTGFLGEIAVVIANTACTLQISHLRTDVVTPVATVLCIASASIAQATAGTMFTLPAAVGSVLTTSTNNSAAAFNFSPSWVLPIGNLDLIGSAAPATGTIKWSMWYIPLDDGAYVTAA